MFKLVRITNNENLTVIGVSILMLESTIVEEGIESSKVCHVGKSKFWSKSVCKLYLSNVLE